MAMWFQDGNPSRAGIIKGRISCVNLQGKGFKGYFIKKQIVEMVFTMELSFGECIKWESSRSFDEFKLFYDTLIQHPKVRANGSRLLSPFPSGNSDGQSIDDVMVLVERKELIDALLREVLQKIDYAYYVPLSDFLRVAEHLSPIERKLASFQRRLRRYLCRRKFSLALFRFYSREINNFSYYLEEGITVIELGQDQAKQEVVLWLDVSEEAALSRICIAPRDIFELPLEYEDDRLANGLFLSDIAEVRSGQGSFGFKTSSRLGTVPNLCLSIVGSERTLDFQLKDAGSMARSAFIDTLRLLVLKSLTYDEAVMRNLRWERELLAEMRRQRGLPPLARPMSTKRIRDANIMMTLLSNSIQVEEEIYSPEHGLQIVSRNLKYEIEEQTFYITSVDIEEESNSKGSSNGTPSSPTCRCIDINDISDVRPGKMGAVIDGSRNMLMLTIVASETILCLPVASLALRDALINRFQSFVEYFKSTYPSSEVFTKRKQPIAVVGQQSLLPLSSSSAEEEHQQRPFSFSSGQGGRSSVAVAQQSQDDERERAMYATSFSSVSGATAFALSHPQHTLFPVAVDTRFSENGTNGISTNYRTSLNSYSPKNNNNSEFDMLDLFEDNASEYRFSGSGGNNGRIRSQDSFSSSTANRYSFNNAPQSGSLSSDVGFVRSAVGVNGVSAVTAAANGRPRKRRSLTGSVTTTQEMQQHQQQYQQQARSPPSTVAAALSLRSVSMVRRSITGNSNSSSPPVSGVGLAFSI